MGFEYRGGALCLDFLNTCDHWNERSGEPRGDMLTRFDDFVTFVSGLPSPEPALLAKAREIAASSRSGPRALRGLTELRSLLRRAFIARSGRAQEDSLRALNAWLGAHPARPALAPGPERLRLIWKAKSASDEILLPLVESALELLCSERRAKVRLCDGADCGYLFLDLSKNHSRRWCDMADCGNRVKAQNFYQRSRSA